MVKTPLSLAEITTNLETWLEVEFTFYKVGELAQVYAQFPRTEQDYLLGWIRRIATTNIEVAWRFAGRVLKVRERMDARLVEAWALHAMDAYDRAGLRAALKVINEVDQFARLSHVKAVGALFSDISGVLLTFVRGLSGRSLKLAEGDATYTDSETLFLPAVIAEMVAAADNFALAKAQVAFLWAQTRFGTFHTDLDSVVARFEDSERALRCFHALESMRLEHCLARELPGLHREMLHLRATLGQSRGEAWLPFEKALATPDIGVDASLSLLPAAYVLGTPPRICYEGEFRPAALRENLVKRQVREKMLFRVKLRELINETQKQQNLEGMEAKRFAATLQRDHGVMEIELLLDGLPIAPPGDMKQLITSIVLDFGEIPPEYLFPAGDGEYDPQLLAGATKSADDVWEGTYHEEGAFLYPEWDHGRQHYRKNWAVVREKSVTPLADDFVTATLTHHAGLVRHLRRVFESMRDEDRLLKRQEYGDNVDIDALVEALAEMRDGREMTDRLFTRMHRTERSMAVMFMVDMSGSTRGWINDAERESLVLLCESLEILGDIYAIYGFSGITRKRCEIFRIKTFDERYSMEVKGRISGIRPQEYTRMGFAIRHLSKRLLEVEAKTRLLVTISDGKPDDYFDGYRGGYGMEDTRKALQESMRAGIHPFCITIDREARDYLPHLYGAANYIVIDDVKQLPIRVADIYRRLTTR
ncbi:nitric oxide reductase NorD protein [Gammaproteobacteria bacterium]